MFVFSFSASPLNKSFFKSAIASVLLLGTFTACDQSTYGEGSQGRLRFYLSSDYHTTSDVLQEVRIVAGHPQAIYSEFLDSEDPLIAEMQSVDGSLAYSMDVMEGVLIEGQSVTVTNPGGYTLAANYDGSLVDSIELVFDKPEAIDVLMWARCATCDSFAAVTGETLTIQEGSQLSPVFVPLDGAGQRLAGDIGVEVTFEPATSVVVGYNVLNANEDGPYYSQEDPWYYVVEPGTITMTVTDPVNGVETIQVLEVTPVAE